jgi:hypothetical protein
VVGRRIRVDFRVIRALVASGGTVWKEHVPPGTTTLIHVWVIRERPVAA